MTSNSHVDRIPDTHESQLERILTLTKGNSKVKFQLNFNVGTPQRSGLGQWRQTGVWSGYLTLKIVNLRGFWLYERKFKTDIWSKYLILMLVNLKKILTLQEKIQNRQMERIHDTHHSPLERILTWQMEIQFHQATSMLGFHSNLVWANDVKPKYGALTLHSW